MGRTHFSTLIQTINIAKSKLALVLGANLDNLYG